MAKRLKRHPGVEARVVLILDLIENVGGDVRRADDAERQAMEELRRMGQEMLSDWVKVVQTRKRDDWKLAAKWCDR